jgi:hypothetical protein
LKEAASEVSALELPGCKQAHCRAQGVNAPS